MPFSLAFSLSSLSASAHRNAELGLIQLWNVDLLLWTVFQLIQLQTPVERLAECPWKVHFIDKVRASTQSHLGYEFRPPALSAWHPGSDSQDITRPQDSIHCKNVLFYQNSNLERALDWIFTILSLRRTVTLWIEMENNANANIASGGQTWRTQSQGWIWKQVLPPGIAQGCGTFSHALPPTSCMLTSLKWTGSCSIVDSFATHGPHGL